VPTNTTSESSASQEKEIARLSQLVNQLRAEISALDQMRSENEKLKAQLASTSTYLTREETAAMDQAREKAGALECVNHLKQLGLAARIWADAHGDKYPADLLQMTNE